jgi:prephenate dehydratase
VSGADVRPIPRTVPRVAFQGEPGAYSEDAVRRFFGNCEVEPLPTVRRVFEQVEIGATAFGVVPVENSQAGSINETYDHLVRHGVRIVGEVVVRVDHALLALPGTRIPDIRQVLSHPQALAQCEEFLANLDAEIVPVYDTAGAAKLIADLGRGDRAAVAGRRAAELYGLEVLTEEIQTYPENFTKFAVIGTDPAPGTGKPDKTSVVFGTANVPGALYRCLGGFAEAGLNLLKLESRPEGGRPWRYRFYLDLEAGAEEPAAVAALAELSSHASYVRLLGTYPAWRE